MSEATETSKITRNKHNYNMQLDVEGGSVKLIIKAKDDNALSLALAEAAKRLDGVKTMNGLD